MLPLPIREQPRKSPSWIVLNMGNQWLPNDSVIILSQTEELNVVWTKRVCSGIELIETVQKLNMHDWKCVKSVRIQSFYGPYFPAFGLNTDTYSVSLHFQSKCGKIRTRKTPNTDTFHALRNTWKKT